MGYEIVAERLVDEWRLASGSTVADILQEWFDGRMRTCKTASERGEFAEARTLVAGATLDFVKSVAEAAGASIGSVMELLRDSSVVRFFSKLGWSFKRLWALLRKGHHAYKELRKIVAEYMATTKVGRWTTDELRKFDEFLKEHPVATRVTGVVLGALLVFIWFNEAFIGDPEYDFDVSEIADSIAGKFSFADIFGGPDGATRLVTLVVGTAVSFPWPGPSSVYFIASVVVMLAHKLKTRLHPAKS